MTPAECKTLREGLGLSAQALARRLGLKSDRTIRWWETGGRRIPEDAARDLAELDTRVERTVMVVVEMWAKASPRARRATLLRYHTDEELRRYQPDTLAMLGSARVHAAMIGRAKRAIEQRGGRVTITFMDSNAYESWLADSGSEDAPEARAAWAALQMSADAG